MVIVIVQGCTPWFNEWVRQGEMGMANLKTALDRTSDWFLATMHTKDAKPCDHSRAVTATAMTRWGFMLDGQRVNYSLMTGNRVTFFRNKWHGRDNNKV
jgi:hypothetical protein